MHEYRHVGAELEAQAGETLAAEPQAPELVEREQRSRGIRAAAAEPRARGDTLVDGDVDPGGAGGALFEQARRAHHQIGILVHAGVRRYSTHTAIGARREGNGVGQIDELKERLQIVIAVVAPAENVQEKIQLRGGGPDRGAHGGVGPE